jgi:hypothetical protein
MLLAGKIAIAGFVNVDKSDVNGFTPLMRSVTTEPLVG